MYLEEDILVSWPTLVSWARDTELLAPLGMNRAMFRVEVAPWNGKQTLIDEFEGMLKALRILSCSNAAKDQHSHYTQLDFSDMGMWVYMADQMAIFLSSQYWNVTILDEEDNSSFPREFAAWGFNQVAKIDGFSHANVVPLDLQRRKLLMVGAIEHLSNNYAAGMHVRVLNQRSHA